MDGTASDGIRLSLADELSDLYLYDLRGNQREGDWRAEGEKVFGEGSQTGAAVLIAVKRRRPGVPCQIHYISVPDQQTRAEKLAGIAQATLGSLEWRLLKPNPSGDWLTQRGSTFVTFLPIGDEPMAHFFIHSQGVTTSRDAWTVNYSRPNLRANINQLVKYYNEQTLQAHGDAQLLGRDSRRISWSRALTKKALAGRLLEVEGDALRTTLYTPFNKKNLYLSSSLNEYVTKEPEYFPTSNHPNLGFYVTGLGSGKPFAVLASDCIVDVALWGSGTGQHYCRWTYVKASDAEQSSLLEAAPSQTDVDERGYRRVDNITDAILAVYREQFGPQVTKDDVFYYVYGVLHSEQYRTTFAADLKRMLPRIPLAATAADFDRFVVAGRALADLHVNYETVEPYPLHEPTVAGIDPWELYRVEKLRWADKTTKKALVFNRHITLGDIPVDAHRYMLGSRSALEWLIDRYQVKIDKPSGIVNDPNDWGREHGDPRYIIDLIKRVTRVSVETMKIVDNLPELDLEA